MFEASSPQLPSSSVSDGAVSSALGTTGQEFRLHPRAQSSWEVRSEHRGQSAVPGPCAVVKGLQDVSFLHL